MAGEEEEEEEEGVDGEDEDDAVVAERLYGLCEIGLRGGEGVGLDGLLYVVAARVAPWGCACFSAAVARGKARGPWSRIGRTAEDMIRFMTAAGGRESEGVDVVLWIWWFSRRG